MDQRREGTGVIDGRLHPEDVAAIARQVAALLRDEPQAPRLLTAEQVAERFGLTAAWIREHATELGALRLGDGPRPRLRFAADTVADALNACCRNRTYGDPDPPEFSPETADRGAGRADTRTSSLPVRQLRLEPSPRNRPRAGEHGRGHDPQGRPPMSEANPMTPMQASP